MFNDLVDTKLNSAITQERLKKNVLGLEVPTVATSW
jgi:hypothetical protein